jgi:hypothetical protein
MRFDLEIEVVDKLTQDGKDKIASLFFSNIQTTNGAVFNNILIPYIPEINLERYRLFGLLKNLNAIDPSNFRSRVYESNTLLFSRLLIKHGSLIPFFSRGTIYFNRYPILFSNDSFRQLLTYDTTLNEYKTEIPVTVDTTTLKIWTSRLSKTGTVDVDKEYNYINSDTVTVEILDSETPPTAYKANTIFITTRGGIADAVYRVTNNGQLIKIFNTLELIDAPIEELYRLIHNGMALVDRLKKRIIVRNFDKFYDYRRKILFQNSKSDYIYTIETDVLTDKRYIYLNNRIETFSQNIYEENVEAGKSRILFFNQYPITNIITSIATSGISIKTSENFIRLTNNNANTVLISGSASGDITPLITYSRNMVAENKDIKHTRVDISPKSINFGDGTLCFTNAELNKSMIASSIDITFPDGFSIQPFGSIRVKVKVLNADGAVIPNATITLELTETLGGLVQWGGIESTSNTITGVTNLSGELILTLVNTDVRLGTYIQKEWVGDVTKSGNSFTVNNKNIIYIPYDIKTTNVNDICLFMITGDDPILGQIKDSGGAYGITADKFTSPTPYDYFQTKGDITSYSLSGRKIAYVELVADKISGTSTDYTITSKHVKPISVEVINSTKSFFMRKLFLYNQNISLYGKNSAAFPNILTDTTNANFQYIPSSDFTITSVQSSGFNINWELINNTFSYCSVNVQTYTKLTYKNDIPGILDSNVLGYFAKIKSSASNISFNASYYDAYLDISLLNTVDYVTLSGMMIDETSFKLSTETGVTNSYLGAYSYLTLSEYLNNTYGTNYATYVCKYSGRIVNQFTNNRCTYPDTNIQNTYYVPADASNLYCKHSIEYDNSIASNLRCPKLDAQLINPFVLYS